MSRSKRHRTALTTLSTGMQPLEDRLLLASQPIDPGFADPPLILECWDERLDDFVKFTASGMGVTGGEGDDRVEIRVNTGLRDVTTSDVEPTAYDVYLQIEIEIDGESVLGTQILGEAIYIPWTPEQPASATGWQAFDLPALRFHLQGGDNRVNIVGDALTTPHLGIITHHGEDQIALDGLTVGIESISSASVRLQTAGGDDTIHIRNANVLGKALIETHSGHDSIKIDALDESQGSTFDDLTIQSGSGDDHVELADSSVEHLVVLLREGSDQLIIRDLVYQDGCLLRTSTGQDTLELDRIEGLGQESMFIVLGPGADHLRGNAITTEGRLNIDAGRHDDTIWLGDVSSEYIFVDSGRGDDEILMTRSRGFRGINLRGGSGKDTVAGLDLRSQGHGYFLGESGNDKVFVKDSWFRGALTVDGGDGVSDRLATASASRTAYRYRNFERFGNIFLRERFAEVLPEPDAAQRHGAATT